VDDPFLRSRQTLAGETTRDWLLGATGVVLLLAAWLAWLVLARIPVYSVSDEARLESAATPRKVQAPVAGSVVARRAELGSRVAAGDILFEIAAELERARMTERESDLTSVGAQLRALDEQRLRAEQVLEGERNAALASRAEARARVDESRAAAEYAEQEARRAEELHASGLLSSSERDARLAEATQRSAAADREAQSLRRLEAQLEAEAQSRQGEIAELERELERLRGAQSQAGAAIQGLAADLERRTVRAPVDGIVAEIAELGSGAVVEEGDELATIVPPGEVAVVAHFSPSEALGRVRAGQRCRVRLQGFSWMRYGVLEARVERVASEARSGRVRVEARLVGDASAAIPREHGLPGVLEVEVERVSPVDLALRAAGRRVGPGPRETPPGAAPDRSGG
jgi:membrane fusion protein (multidrug efflux system)